MCCSNQHIEMRNGPFCEISSHGGVGNQEKCGQKCCSGIRKKSGNRFVFFLEGECQGVGALEKERNKTRKILIKRR